MRRIYAVGGFDLSLRASAFCAIPINWKFDWSRIAIGGAGQQLERDVPEADRLDRLRRIRDAAVDFARRNRIRVAAIENYAFQAPGQTDVRAIGELGGVVKVALYEHGCAIETIMPASARKLLGKQPRKGSKLWSAQKIYDAGAPKTWSLDHVDAFVVANFYLAGVGGDAIMMEQGVA